VKQNLLVSSKTEFTKQYSNFLRRNRMQLKHLQSITRPGDGIVKVTAVCWAPNGKRLAICTTDRVVQMFDEDGVPKDKFFTKPADKVSS
jgi:hypothetical protein